MKNESKKQGHKKVPGRNIYCRNGQHRGKKRSGCYRSEGKRIKEDSKGMNLEFIRC